ncbi:MAG TPA: D-alanyl-D-alanine carboxypeptidase, partial [Thermopolyspora sp.]
MTSRGRVNRPVAALLGGAFLVLLAPARAGAAPATVPADTTPIDTVGGDLLAGRGLIVPAGVKAPPKTSASSFVIADADTGQVLAAKDPHGYY